MLRLARTRRPPATASSAAAVAAVRRSTHAGAFTAARCSCRAEPTRAGVANASPALTTAHTSSPLRHAVQTQRALLHTQATARAADNTYAATNTNAAVTEEPQPAASADAASSAAADIATAASPSSADAGNDEFASTFDIPQPAAAPGQTAAAAAASARAKAAADERRRRAQPPPPVVATWGAGWTGALGRDDYAPSSVPVRVKFPRFFRGEAVQAAAAGFPNAAAEFAAAAAAAGLPEPAPAAVAANWGRSVMISQRGSIFDWGWRKPFRMLLQVAGWQRKVGWLVAALQRRRLGMLTLCGGDPLTPHRVPNWGFEHGDAPLTPTSEDGKPAEERLYAVQVVTGSDYSAVLSSTGQAYTWGSNFYGQLGQSFHLSDWHKHFPTIVSQYQNQHPNESWARSLESGLVDLPKSFPSTQIVQVAAGFAHTLFLTRAGQVYACGKSDTGALGITHIYRDSKRVFLPHLIPVTDAYWAGENGSGEPSLRERADDSGEGTTTPHDLAQNSEDIIDQYVGPIVAVAAGMKHSLLLTARGEVLAAGANGLGELGDGSFHPRAGFIKVPIPYALAEGRGGRSAHWKHNRLASAEEVEAHADADSESFFSPAARGSPSSERIVQIAAGLHHSLALSSAGHVYAWGLDQQNQCGVKLPLPSDESSAEGGSDSHSSVARGWNPRSWLRNVVSRKRAAPTLADVQAAEDARVGHILADAVAPYRRAALSNLAPVNSARQAQVSHMVAAPTRIPLEMHAARMGISQQQLGQVTRISAGFHDSTLITDRGYTISFGGGLSPSGASVPHLMRLDHPLSMQAEPSEQERDSAASAQQWGGEQVLQQARVSQMAFGLAHAIAIVQPAHALAHRG